MLFYATWDGNGPDVAAHLKQFGKIVFCGGQTVQGIELDEWARFIHGGKLHTIHGLEVARDQLADALRLAKDFAKNGRLAIMATPAA